MIINFPESSLVSGMSAGCLVMALPFGHGGPCVISAPWSDHYIITHWSQHHGAWSPGHCSTGPLSAHVHFSVLILSAELSNIRQL